MTEFVVPPNIKNELAKAKAIVDKKELIEKNAKEAELEAIFPEIDVSDAELEKFWDCMLKKEAYTEEIKIKNLSIVFKTRSNQEINDLVMYMDKTTYALPQTTSKIQLDCALASSLVSIGEDNIDKGSLDQKLNWIAALPSPLTRVILDKLDLFDSKVLKMGELLKKGNF